MSGDVRRYRAYGNMASCRPTTTTFIFAAKNGHESAMNQPLVVSANAKITNVSRSNKSFLSMGPIFGRIRFDEEE